MPSRPIPMTHLAMPITMPCTPQLTITGIQSDANSDLAGQWDNRGDGLQLVMLIMALGLAFAAWGSLLKEESNMRLLFCRPRRHYSGGRCDYLSGCAGRSLPRTHNF